MSLVASFDVHPYQDSGQSMISIWEIHLRPVLELYDSSKEVLMTVFTIVLYGITEGLLSQP